MIPGQAPNTQVMEVDATALLQRLPAAYQSYFNSHNVYPNSPRDLVIAGLVKQEDVQVGRQQMLRSVRPLPARADLPGDLIVAYVISMKDHSYTVLFGDWHVQSMSMPEFATAQGKSRKAALGSR